MITTLTGENDVLRQNALRQIVDSFVAEHTDMGLERIDGEEADYDHMLAAVQSLPFLASKKLVVLRAPGKNKSFTENFEQFTKEIAETNDVLIVEAKLDKRLSYYKQLKKLTDFREFSILDANGLAHYAQDYAKHQGGSISSSDARMLVDRIGNNQLALQHELDKLLIHDSKITRDSIELLTEKAPQSSIFELLDAAFSGNQARMMSIYREQRALRVEPQQMLAMLAWQLYILAVIKTARDRTPDEIARAAKLSPYSVKNSMKMAQRLSYARLKSLISTLREYDVRLKSEAMNADEVLQYYLLSVSASK